MKRIQRSKNAEATDWRSVLDGVGKKLGIKSPEDWYEITSDKIIRNGGRYMLTRCGHTTYTLVTFIYPEHEWILHCFNRRRQPGEMKDACGQKELN